MNPQLREAFEGGDVVAALLGDDPYFISDVTFRDRHDRILALHTLLDWATTTKNETKAAHGLLAALETAVARRDRPTAYDLVWCYFLVTDSAGITLPIDLVRVSTMLRSIDVGPEPDPEPLDEVRSRVTARLPNPSMDEP